MQVFKKKVKCLTAGQHIQYGQVQRKLKSIYKYIYRLYIHTRGRNPPIEDRRETNKQANRTSRGC